MEEKSALIAMSGGVDSSVSAHLMLERGYRCEGVTMRLFCHADAGSEDGDRDIRDAGAIAQRLGIPFGVADYAAQFRKNVMEPFVRTYEEGRTPNPCIDCNRTMKFGALLALAREKGLANIATGHYARIEYDAACGRWLLKKAADIGKDQTYVLYMLTQDQLAHTIFPLGGMTKEDARALAEEHGFVNARKHDSQDICFIPDGDYVRFMEGWNGKPYQPGDFLDLEGKPVGRHRGAVAYTIGQRKGLGLAMGRPVYVCGKDMAANTVTVGSNEVLFSSALLADSLNWIAFERPEGPVPCAAKIRYNQKEQPAVVYPREDGTAEVRFSQPQRAVSPGQAVVFYRDDIVLGGGTIRCAL